jgi:hypothetical protein
MAPWGLGSGLLKDAVLRTLSAARSRYVAARHLGHRVREKG